MLVRVIGKPLYGRPVGAEFSSPVGQANVLMLLGRVELVRDESPGLTAESHAGSDEPQRIKRKYTRRDVTARNLETK